MIVVFLNRTCWVECTGPAICCICTSFSLVPLSLTTLHRIQQLRSVYVPCDIVICIIRVINKWLNKKLVTCCCGSVNPEEPQGWLSLGNSEWGGCHLEIVRAWWEGSKKKNQCWMTAVFTVNTAWFWLVFCQKSQHLFIIFLDKMKNMLKKWYFKWKHIGVLYSFISI